MTRILTAHRNFAMRNYISIDNDVNMESGSAMLIVSLFLLIAYCLLLIDLCLLLIDLCLLPIAFLLIAYY